MRMEVIENGRAVPKELHSAVLLRSSERFRDRQSRVQRRVSKLPDAPDRRSVARAMLKVEERLVAAYSVLNRSTSNPSPKAPSRNGLGYILEREDKWSIAVAGGGWLSQEPPAPPPSAAEIDAMDEPLEWLLILDRPHAEIVSAGARAKEGDIDRRISWIRVRLRMPQFSSWSSQKLRRAYFEGLRTIAAEVKL